MATTGVLSSIGTGSPNKLLYVGALSGPTSSAPTSSPAPPGPTATVQMYVDYDDYPQETTFILEKKNGNSWITVKSVGVPASGTDDATVTEALSDGDYKFTINDSYGDGICCAYGQGSYKLTDVGASWVFATGGEFQSSEFKLFTVLNGKVVGGPSPATSAPTAAPVPATSAPTSAPVPATSAPTSAPVPATSSPTSTPATPSPTQAPTDPPVTPPTDSVVFTLVLDYDEYPEETSVKFHKKVGSSWVQQYQVNAPSYYPAPDYVRSDTLPNGLYRFRIFDSWGDGIADYGGSYTLKANGDTFKQGGSFGSRDTVKFRVLDGTVTLV